MKNLLFISVMLYATQSFGQSNNYVKSKKANNLETRDISIFEIEENPLEVLSNISYYDDFGRLSQVVDKQLSPLKRDVIQIVEYDETGRESKKYLPYASLYEGSGSFKYGANFEISTFYSTAARVEHSAKYFSETQFEDSPRDRVIKQGAPGADWQIGQGHEISKVYRYNLNNEVINWTYNASLANPTVSGISFYTAKQLFVEETTDENGNKTLVFTDKSKKTILEKVQVSPTHWDETYYVYNKYGNVAYVIPPQAVVDLESKSSGINTFNENDQIFKQYIYAYKYDTRQRNVKKKIPAADWLYMVYNLNDQLVLSQDGEMRLNGEWIFSKYDLLGRNVLTGICSSSDNQSMMQNAVDAHPIVWESRNGSNFSQNFGYSNSAYPTVGISYILTAAYFDDYDLDKNGSQDKNASVAVTNRTRGLPTAITEKVLYDAGSGYIGPEYLTTFTFYDEELRPVQIIQDNHKGYFNVGTGKYEPGTDVITSTYNNNSTVEKITVQNTAYTNGISTTTSLQSRYTYDHANRKKEYFHKINNNAEELLAVYNYNELGQLVEKNLHVDQDPFSKGRAQSVDYCYNVRGWLKQINDPDRLNVCDNSATQKGLTCDDLKDLELDLSVAMNNHLVELEVKKQVSAILNPSYSVIVTLSEGESGEVIVDDDGNMVTIINLGLTDYINPFLPQFNTTTFSGASFITDLPWIFGLVITYSQTEIQESLRTGKLWDDNFDPCLWMMSQFGPVGPNEEYTPEMLEGLIDHLLATKYGALTAEQKSYIKGILLNKMTRTQTSNCVNCDNDDDDDLFGMRLKYNEGFTELNAGAVPLYNGNISGIEWSNKRPTDGVSTTDESKQGYAFKYDAKGQLLNAWSGVNFSGWTISNFMDRQTSSYSYDKMGNLLTLSRQGAYLYDDDNDPATPNILGKFNIDNLVYDYDGNRLRSVEDISTDPMSSSHGFLDLEHFYSEYTYNKNGNMTSDQNTGTQNVAYNILDLTKKVENTNGDVFYIYTASGAKIQKISNLETRDYLNGIEFTSISANHDLPEFVATEEGRVILENTTSYTYEYTISDHLGNARVVFKTEFSHFTHTYGANLADFQVYNYYPFGLVMDSEGMRSAITDPNKYQYNGKELQPETGWNDYGARMYDATIGRWMVWDPLAEHPTQISLTPYQYAWNSPINVIDPDGRIGQRFNKPPDEWIVRENADGSTTNEWVGETGGDDIDYLEYVNKDGEVYKTEEKEVIVTETSGKIIREPGFRQYHNATPVIFQALAWLAGEYAIVKAGGWLFGARAAKATEGVIAVERTVEAVKVGEYALTETVAGHLSTRPYISSPSTINNIIETGVGVADEFVEGAMRYTVSGSRLSSKNKVSQGVYELVVHPETKTIYHFLFRSN
jgi:RHS repeat-associated protein